MQGLALDTPPGGVCLRLLQLSDAKRQNGEKKLDLASLLYSFPENVLYVQ